jgi:hypothetical protein
LENDLIAACVYCGALLFGPNVPPVFGFTGELAGAYGVYQRQIQVDGTEISRSDTTGKFPLLGFGWSKGARDGLGAGTPASEASFRFGFGVSHDQATEAEGTPDRLEVSGQGRFENWELVGRGAIGPRGSLEGAMVQHRHVITDVVTLGGPFGEALTRYLVAGRQDFLLGWRQRFPCAEIGVRGEYAVLQGKLNNAGGALLTRGGIPGAGLDAAILLGNWRLSAGGEYLSGTVERLDQYGPDFAQQSGSDPASIYGAGLRGSGRFGIVVIDLGLFWERAKLPWVSFAVLGLEQRLFEAGFRPSSDSTNKGLDLRVRVKVATGVYVQIFSRRGQASETVTFTDALDSRPPVTLAVRAPSRQQYMYGLGVTFALGSASAPNPAP